MSKNIKLLKGDCVKEMATLDDNSIDAIVTDPPYGLKFMGKEFDDLGEGAQQREWHKAWATEALRVLKPGGHLLAFGGTRTYHHLATAVEEAGFEIRDQIQWLYGSGFPKSLNVGKAIDKKKGKKRKVVGKKDTYTGKNKEANTFMASPRLMDVTALATEEAARWEGWGTALKPANEPCVLARKPFRGTVAENVQEWGTGAMNIDGCRVGTEKILTTNGKGFAGSFEGGTNNQGGKQTEGRWPANVILDKEAGELLDEQSGTLKSGKPGKRSKTATSGSMSGDLGVLDRTEPGIGDQGGASRFFYCPKAGKKERNAGLKKGNNHPTVKPVALMAYLIRLITPPGGTVLDPFLGSGSTGLAAIEEDSVVKFIGIEKDPEYMKIAKARIDYWQKEND